MIRAAHPEALRRPGANPQRGEFEAILSGERRRFDTRLSTVAAIERACGERAIVDVLNAIIIERRAKDQIPLLSAALAAATPACDDPDEAAAAATVGEAEAFILALVFALGFTLGPQGGRQTDEKGGDGPFARPSAGDAGASSPSAA